MKLIQLLEAREDEILAEATVGLERANPEMLRILIVHHSNLGGSLMASVLSGEADVVVTDWTTTVKEALTLIHGNHYDVIVAAAALPDRGALKLTEILAARGSHPKVVVVGGPESKEAILRYVMAGAAGYVSQGVSAAGLLDSIRAATRNEALVSPEIAAALIAEARRLFKWHQGQQNRLHIYRRLTHREQEVLELIALDCTNQEIARRLRLSQGTVKNHVHQILKKLGVNDRQKAITLWRLFRQSPGEVRPATRQKSG